MSTARYGLDLYIKFRTVSVRIITPKPHTHLRLLLVLLLLVRYIGKTWETYKKTTLFRIFGSIGKRSTFTWCLRHFLTPAHSIRLTPTPCLGPTCTLMVEAAYFTKPDYTVSQHTHTHTHTPVSTSPSRSLMRNDLLGCMAPPH